MWVRHIGSTRLRSAPDVRRTFTTHPLLSAGRSCPGYGAGLNTGGRCSPTALTRESRHGGAFALGQEPEPRSPSGKVGAARSVRCAILMQGSELPFRALHQRKVVVWIGHLVPGAAVTDLKDKHVAAGAVLQVVRGALRRETGAHARKQFDLTVVRDQRGVALKHVNQFVLHAVPVVQCRDIPAGTRVRLTPKALRPNRSPRGCFSRRGEPQQGRAHLLEQPDGLRVEGKRSRAL